ncbi:acetyltransferase [Roseiconus nitratireducens]|uniref:Acetyltransferase n=1 Tax=Roseiconus nitratireducens TaxID=2605748 RepID=A0A5M6D7H5_9BACT|nr:acetyltransferase [Roseiconus nitratireducens]KAA5542606.1 acetyltransferase [Roseiconus nitratireducens]
MFVKEKSSGDLIRIDPVDVLVLADPLAETVSGRRQAGEEEQDRDEYRKEDLIFPSGESFPKCWTEPSYQLSKAH